MYNEQRRFHKGDEQVEKQESSETYYAIKEHPFIIDCYLLPHESQDIWLQNLTQGKLAKSRDNDGMFVIPKRLLFGKITGHLKGCQKFLAKGFNLSRFVSQLNPIPVQQSCVHFDTEAAKLNLKVCTYFLHNAVNDQLTNDAVKGLRQYHSVANVYHFPLCENFMSHISLIRRDAWKVFQSETKQWIISQISEPGPHEFDFLTLWEQASKVHISRTIMRVIATIMQGHEGSRERECTYGTNCPNDPLFSSSRQKLTSWWWGILGGESESRLSEIG